MNTIKEIQERILAETGLKTSVRKLNGSQKGYIKIMPIFQEGKYPNFPWEFIQKMKAELAHFNREDIDRPLFCFIGDISIYGLDHSDAITMKKEAKPKPIEQMKVKTWGSENSQMRLDKAAARHAKRVKKGNTVRYW